MANRGDEFLGTVGAEFQGSAHVSIVDETSESHDLEDSFGEIDPEANLTMKRRQRSFDGNTSPTNESTSNRRATTGRTNSGNTSSRFRRTSVTPSAVPVATTTTSTAAAASTLTNLDDSAPNIWAQSRHMEPVDQSVNLMDSVQNITYEPEKPRGPGMMKSMASLRQKSLVDIFFDGDEGGNSRGAGGAGGYSDYGVDDLSGQDKRRKKWRIFLFLLMALLVITFMVVMVPKFGAVSWSGKEDEVDPNKTTPTPKETDAPEELVHGQASLPPKSPTPAPNTDNEDEEEAEAQGETTAEDRPLPEPEEPIVQEAAGESATQPSLDLSDIPSDSRLHAFEFYVVDQDVTDQEQLDIMGSPAKKALHWITQQDPAQLPIPGYDADPSESVQNDEFAEYALLQRYALAVFYFSQEEANNEEGNSRLRHNRNRKLQEEEEEYEDATQEELDNREAFDSSWLSAEPICRWHGISCAGAEEDEVMEVTLPKHLFQGTVPRELLVGAAMPFLINLDLEHNRLAGDLPRVTPERENAGQELGVAPQPSELRSLRLNYNKLTGSMNVLLGLPKLKQLHLSHNQLTGSLPVTMRWDFESLEELDLSHNKFSGAIESLARMTTLKNINLELNTFSGELPRAIDEFTQLEQLDLSGNQFNGGIPDGYGKLTGLQLLDLEGNQLDGSVPTQLGQLSQLQSLQLDSNNLTGEMPQEVCALREDALRALVTDCTSGDIQCDCCTGCS